jgi:hypothetical protein
MIVDYEMCLRVGEGDDELALITTPYYCPTCCQKPETYSAKVRFGNRRIPVCEDHDSPLEMEVKP